MDIRIFLWFSLLIANGVFGDEVKSVSVMEGHSVTLHTDLIRQRDDLIKWYYGPENTVVARFNGKADSIIYSDDERFKDRVKMNNQTGDLIITHITSQHSGLYTLKINRNMKASYKRFNITVYARLPVPVISRVSSQCSSSSSSSCCCVLCSVMNVSHDVSVSWYKGKSLLSSISVSDLNIRLSLPLEVEYQDTNTYRCVLNNPITNITQHLNITQLCQACSDSPALRFIIISVVFVLLMISVIIISVCIRRRGNKANLMKTSQTKESETDEESRVNSSSTFKDTEDSDLSGSATLLNNIYINNEN